MYICLRTYLYERSLFIASSENSMVHWGSKTGQEKEERGLIRGREIGEKYHFRGRFANYKVLNTRTRKIV